MDCRRFAQLMINEEKKDHERIMNFIPVLIKLFIIYFFEENLNYEMLL